MKIKKLFAAMAATAVSAASFAVMAVPSASAADVVAVAGLRGQAGTYHYWGEDDNSGNLTVKDAQIDGNAQYEATWDITGDGTGSIEFFILEIKETATLGNAFTADTFPDLSLTVDEIYIDGEEINFTQNGAAINLKYYESATKRGTRAYLTDTWNVNDGGTLGIAADQPITSQVKVVFTVGGLYNDGTSNVTEDTTDAPTEGATDAPTDAPTEGAQTTTAASGNNGETTTTTAAPVAGDSKSTTTAAPKAGDSKSTTTTKAPANGGKTEASTNTGDAGVGVAAAAIVLAGTAAFAARKRK